MTKYFDKEICVSYMYVNMSLVEDFFTAISILRRLNY